MRDEEEIRKAFEVASEKGKTQSAYRHIADALGWVLGEYDDDPSK